ncbi:PSD1 and planctomycete cytochrome C domain-containing protein [Catalinimonas alkaloidigena]|uniref:PSD1 and planctomycete cytochrome C domain-containing protein n=1 Tax=Catalinimonas alkaloidigena TaxID=1075417 RepID=UPI0024066BC8|nr:PSD1 and planctomycete cytochrome C domain-containing protein [Catalinimonas alkaloidigena]
MIPQKLSYWLSLPLLLLIILQGCHSLTDNQNEQVHVTGKISYNFHIRPILSDKCFACHGPDANKREAGLRLDMAESAYKALEENPNKHAIVPGEPSSSSVFLRISSTDEAQIMPPPESELKLSEHEIKLIERWIRQGAEYEPHWAFVAPKDQALPKVKNKAWPVNEIDFFVLHKQEQNGLTPNEEADKERLLKRLSFDITGLPPSLEMMNRFLADSSAQGYEKIVDELLQSSAYGERMAVHWMDVSRYADSYGYQMDNFRSQWPWRDWVIHAFNKNMPYDQFITWQLAGDLMPNATKEQILATGFNRNHKITEEGAIDEEEYRVTYVTDRTNTVGKSILGVTLECANCHDHKYDPLSQKEYFQMFAFFNNVDELRDHYTAIDPTVGTPEGYAKKPLIEITDEDVEEILSFVNKQKQDTNRLIVSVMGEMDTLRPTYLLERGVFDAYGEEVQPATPESILSFDNKYPKNRLGLARWIFDEQNPLTSRVFVNRVWQLFFGKGIVKTAGDFGMQGDLPTHPELLDWLAVDFMKNGWDIKRLIKQIVTSATYRQSAKIKPDIQDVDPENVLLTHSPRYHLQAEFIRNLLLSSSGLLDKTIGGPSVKPYQPDGLWEAATAGGSNLSDYVQDHSSNLYRRGLYTFIKRTVPPPSMLIFDASNRDQCEIGRANTNTPLQALVMMNDPTVLEASRVLAARLLEEEANTEQILIKAFRLIVCRMPKKEEVNLLSEYYKHQLVTIKKQNAQKMLAVGEHPHPENIEPTKLAALMQVISMIYNLEETITKT